LPALLVKAFVFQMYQDMDVHCGLMYPAEVVEDDFRSLVRRVDVERDVFEDAVREKKDKEKRNKTCCAVDG
jgi:hypothetical protein